MGTKLKFSTAYHPQTDGQTEVLNRCLETYLRCFTSAHPRRWSRFLCWAELWYSTTYHTAIKTTPFHVVYGREPPRFLQYEEGSTTNGELESLLREREKMLKDIKDHLCKAQSLMKNNANKSRRDVVFDIGSLVFLKLRPYCQSMVARRWCQKHAAIYYGPLEVLERIGAVAYKHKLPEHSRIHPVFHVSQLKQVLGMNHAVNLLPPTLSTEGEFVVEPQDVLDTRYTSGHLEVLVSWKSLPEHENTWLLIRDLKHQFLEFQLEGKLSVAEGGIDKPWRVYISKRNRVHADVDGQSP